MKLLYIADINSPIARNWIRYFAVPGNEIEVISYYPVVETGGMDVRIHVVPLLYSSLFRFSTTQLSQARANGKRVSKHQEQTANVFRSLNRRFSLQTLWKSYIAPLEVLRKRADLQQIVDLFQPDLIHAMRTDPEGYSVVRLSGARKILSTWGNDFTFYARQSRLTEHLTRAACATANGLHTDCRRDLDLAQGFGFPVEGETLLVPTSGGIPARAIERVTVERWRQQLEIPKNAPVVINPRGVRTYVRVREFFEAIPMILQQCPEAVFICTGLHASSLAAQLVRALGIANAVRILPVVSQDDLAALFNLADVMVSPTDYDGTPNTLLEAMAQGAFPVASDLDSIREWIIPGENGLLIDPKSSDAMAQAILLALNNTALRARARELNLHMIRARADFETCMEKARIFYERVMETDPSPGRAAP